MEKAQDQKRPGASRPQIKTDLIVLLVTVRRKKKVKKDNIMSVSQASYLALLRASLKNEHEKTGLIRGF